MLFCVFCAGFERNYYMLFEGFGHFCTLLMLFSAAVCWVLADLPPELPGVTVLRWILAFTYLGVAYLVCLFRASAL